MENQKEKNMENDLETGRRVRCGAWSREHTKLGEYGDFMNLD